MRSLYFRLPVILAASFLLFACSKPAPPPVQRTEVLSAAEVRALFVDKTVAAATTDRGRKSTTYYDPSGEARQSRTGILYIGFWRVSKNGRICLQFEAGERCRIVAKDGGIFKNYVVGEDGRPRPMVDYIDFHEGNPLGL